MILVPSPNSAFSRPGNIERRDVCPSLQLRKRILFDEKLTSRTNERSGLTELIHNQQTAFESRWGCNCDVIINTCHGHRVEPIRTAKIPKCDWAPIDPNFDSEVKSDAPANSKPHRRCRPVAPVPFRNLSNSLEATLITCNGNKENNDNFYVTFPQGYPTPRSSPESGELSKYEILNAKNTGR